MLGSAHADDRVWISVEHKLYCLYGEAKYNFKYSCLLVFMVVAFLSGSWVDIFVGVLGSLGILW